MPCKVKGVLSHLDMVHVQVPQHFRCPISLELMRDPVILSTGHTYDRSSIEKWVASGNTTCPLTMQPLPTGFSFIPNHTLRRLIQEWCVANRSRGVDRIPTPKQPADPNRVSLLLTESSAPSLCALRCLVEDDVRNREVLVGQSAVPVLMAVLFRDSSSGSDSIDEVMEEALAVLVLLLPFTAGEKTAAMQLGRLQFLARVLRAGSAVARMHVAEILGALAETDDARSAIAETEGLVEALIQLICVSPPLSPPHLAAQVAIKCLQSLCLCQAGKQIAIAVSAPAALLDWLLLSADSADSAEPALTTLGHICSMESGCLAVARHNSAAPALLKFVLKSANRAATEHALRALLAACARSENARRCALEAGVMKELLLVLQSSSSSQAKAHALELLKLFHSACFNNPSRLPTDSGGRADVVAF